MIYIAREIIAAATTTPHRAAASAAKLFRRRIILLCPAPVVCLGIGIPPPQTFALHATMAS